MFTKDLAKQVFAGKKKLLKLKEKIEVCVTRFDELSVKSLYDDFMKLEGVHYYFPDTYPKGRVCDREYMFNIVNTLHEDIVMEIIEHALKQRHMLNEDFETKESVLMTDEWKKELEKLPLKVSVSISITNTISFYRKKDG